MGKRSRGLRNLPREVGIDFVFEHQALKSGADMSLVGSVLCRVHWTMAHRDYPRSLGSVDAGEILS